MVVGTNLCYEVQQPALILILILILLQPPGVEVPSKPDVGTAYLYAVLMFVFPLVGAMALVHSNRLAIQIQIKLRAELTSAVYRKALRLSARCSELGNSEARSKLAKSANFTAMLCRCCAARVQGGCAMCRAKQQTETGRIVNLMSADVNNVMVRTRFAVPYLFFCGFGFKNVTSTRVEPVWGA